MQNTMSNVTSAKNQLERLSIMQTFERYFFIIHDKLEFFFQENKITKRPIFINCLAMLPEN